VRNEIAQMAQRISAYEMEFEQRDRAISNSPGNHNEIAQEIGAKIAKVPMVELSEYGHDRDPEQVMALMREQARRDRDRAAFELAERAKLYKQRKAQYSEWIAAYQIWLKQNQGRINTSRGDAFHNNNTDMAVAGYENELINVSERLARYSEESNEEAARYEREYQEKVAGSNTAVTRASKTRS
jgi:hypothetical protein